MVGPEDAGAQGGAALLPSGREEEAEEASAASEADGETDGERDGSREGSSAARLQRYLAGKRPPNGDVCGGGRMTNGDAGFLLLPPPPPPPQEGPASPEEPPPPAPLHNGGCAFFLPAAPSGMALEEPLKSCSLAGAALSPPSSSSGSPSPVSEEAESPASPARALPCLAHLAFMDINLNSRNTFEVSRRRSAPEHLQQQQRREEEEEEPPSSPQPPSAQAAAAGPDQGDGAKRLGGIGGSSFAEFFTRWNFWASDMVGIEVNST
ncbi:UNVERIFIED_CONTAM: hypothetical protein K2H54_033834 [Gekko kuhli]